MSRTSRGVARTRPFSTRDTFAWEHSSSWATCWMVRPAALRSSRSRNPSSLDPGVRSSCSAQARACAAESWWCRQLQTRRPSRRSTPRQLAGAVAAVIGWPAWPTGAVVGVGSRIGGQLRAGVVAGAVVDPAGQPLGDLALFGEVVMQEPGGAAGLLQRVDHGQPVGVERTAALAVAGVGGLAGGAGAFDPAQDRQKRRGV